MNFPAGGHWYLVEHDELLRVVSEETTYWTDRGQYHSRSPSRTLLERLAPYRVGGDS